MTTRTTYICEIRLCLVFPRPFEDRRIKPLIPKVRSPPEKRTPRNGGIEFIKCSWNKRRTCSRVIVRSMMKKNFEYWSWRTEDPNWARKGEATFYVRVRIVLIALGIASIKERGLCRGRVSLCLLQSMDTNKRRHLDRLLRNYINRSSLTARATFSFPFTLSLLSCIRVYLSSSWKTYNVPMYLAVSVSARLQSESKSSPRLVLVTAGPE
jgi:hypothetical protein